MPAVDAWKGVYRGYVVHIRRNTLPVTGGFWLGYLAVTVEHPWFGEDYDQLDAEVHCGLTYGALEDGEWVLGFDYAHHGDIGVDYPMSDVQEQLWFLADQAATAQQEDIRGMRTRRDHIAYKLIDLLGKAQLFLYTKVIQEHVWHSQNGLVTPIRELRNKHLMNIWKKFERDGDYENPRYRPIVDEALKRGLVYNQPHGPD